MRESVSACCALVLLCGGLWTLCTACESTKKTRKEQVAKAAAAAPAHKPQPVKSTRPRPTPQEQITAAFDGFARTTAEKGTRRVKRFVVLPFAEPSARTTVLSKHLAGMMADALRSRGLQRLERENLAELFAEARMNEMTGEGNIKTARVMGADILVVGEYAQAGGRIAMKARARIAGRRRRRPRLGGKRIHPDRRGIHPGGRVGGPAAGPRETKDPQASFRLLPTGAAGRKVRRRPRGPFQAGRGRGCEIRSRQSIS